MLAFVKIKLFQGIVRLTACSKIVRFNLLQIYVFIIQIEIVLEGPESSILVVLD